MKFNEISEVMEWARRERKKLKLEINADGTGRNECKVFIRHLEIERPEDLTKRDS